MLCCALSWPVFAQTDGDAKPPDKTGEKPQGDAADAPAPVESPADEPISPYSDEPTGEAGTGADEPISPYSDEPAGQAGADNTDEGSIDEPIAPYPPPDGSGAEDDAEDDAKDDDDPPALGDPTSGDPRSDKPRDRRGQNSFMLFTSAFGATLGAAIAGPVKDGEFTGSAQIVGVIGLTVGLGVGYAVKRKDALTTTQTNLAAWSGVWGGLLTGLAADLVSGVGDTGFNEVFRGVALGGIWGTLTGLAQGTGGSAITETDVALFNSGGLYGLGTALLLVDVLNPPTSEAYTVNAMLGSLAGLGLGALAARRWNPSPDRVRLVDLGVVIGGLTPWVVLYPIIADRQYARPITDTLSFVGMISGGYLAWRATRNRRPREKLVRADGGLPPVPGLLQRSSDGLWRLGPPSLRPVYNPTLSAGEPASQRGALIDVLGGRF